MTRPTDSLSRRTLMLGAVGATAMASASPAPTQRTSSLPDKASFAATPVAYLDSASTHPVSLGARAAMDAYVAARTLDPAALARKPVDRAGVIAKFARLINADADEITWVQSTTMGEQAVLHWGAVYGISCISLRLFNVFGPRSRTTGAYGAVFGVFLAQRAHGVPLTIVGDGTQTRDFVFVSDVVEAFVAAGSSEVTREVFNVGSGAPQSVNTLAALIGGPITRVPKRPGEPETTHADIGRIRARLGWFPKVGFEEGVRVMRGRLGDWADAPVWTPSRIDEATREWFARLGHR